MELNEYQQRAMETCMLSSSNFSCMMLNLVGEVGEFASKVAKAKRKKILTIEDCDLLVEENDLIPTDREEEVSQMSEDRRKRFFANRIVQNRTEMANLNKELIKEAGDILWQLSGLCSVMGWDLEDVAQANLNKLSSRKQRNVIDGNGDNR